jgi:hypothetical protein
MRGFLNGFMERNKKLPEKDATEYSTWFRKTIELVFQTITHAAFRPQRTLNAAVFDAVMVGLAARLMTGPPISDANAVRVAYEKLLADPAFIEAYTRSTSDEEKVKARIGLAKDAFSGIL